jgi:hypothetical protein
MTPGDILFFKCMAGVSTAAFTLLVYFILRYLQGVLEVRTKLIALVADLGRNVDPIVAELRVAAQQFRAAGERINHSAGQAAEFGDRLNDVTVRVQKSVKMAWNLLAQASNALLKF